MTENINWVPMLTRKFPVFQNFIYMIGARDYADIMYILTVPSEEGGNTQWLNKDEQQQNAKKLLEKFKNTKTFSSDFIQDCYDKCEKLLSTSKKMEKMKFDNLSNEQLHKIFSEWMEAYLALVLHMFSPHVIELALNNQISEWIKNKLKEIDKSEKIEEYLGTLLISTKDTFANLEQKELLKIAVKSSSLSESKVNDLIDEHTKKWAWMTMGCISNPPRSKESFKMAYSALKQYEAPEVIIQDMENQKKKQILEMQTLLKELSPPDNIKNMIELLQEFIFLRTYRMDIYGQANYLVQPLLGEIAKRAGLSSSEILYLTHLEIFDFIKNKQIVSKNEISKRMKAFGFSIKSGIISPILSGEDAYNLKKIELEHVKIPTENVKTINGQIAFRGLAEGMVRIINNDQDMRNFKDGEVLVAKMTTPDYVMVMEKASAIVTDEGGVTCHAAIVSRELEIPCIVGTRVATQILKTGDYVVVDANSGVIQKVNRSKITKQR